MWAAHEICYEQHLRVTARSSMAWLGTFSASLRDDATRAHLLQLLEREYPDTHQLAAACISDDSGSVGVADEFWESLPLAQMSDEDLKTIERAIVALYADILEDGRAYHGALGAAMGASPPAVSVVPEGAVPPGAADATPPATSEVCMGCTALRPSHVSLRPAVAIQPRHDPRERSRGSGARKSHGRTKSRDRRRPRPLRHRRSCSRRPPRSKRLRSRRSRSSIPRKPPPRHSSAEGDALMLRPRARSRY